MDTVVVDVTRVRPPHRKQLCLRTGQNQGLAEPWDRVGWSAMCRVEPGNNMQGTNRTVIQMAQTFVSPLGKFYRGRSEIYRVRAPLSSVSTIVADTLEFWLKESLIFAPRGSTPTFAGNPPTKVTKLGQIHITKLTLR